MHDIFELCCVLREFIKETYLLATLSKLFITLSSLHKQQFGLLQASCRAASVLSHILKDNVQCKERVRIFISLLSTIPFCSIILVDG